MNTISRLHRHLFCPGGGGGGERGVTELEVPFGRGSSQVVDDLRSNYFSNLCIIIHISGQIHEMNYQKNSQKFSEVK